MVWVVSVDIFTRQFKACFMRGVKRVNDICGYLIIPLMIVMFVTMWFKYPEHQGSMINIGALIALIFGIYIIVFAPIM